MEIAKRSLQTCGQICRYTVAHENIERNPGADVNTTTLRALYRMGYKGRTTGHRFRGIASTVPHEPG